MVPWLIVKSSVVRSSVVRPDTVRAGKARPGRVRPSMRRGWLVPMVLGMLVLAGCSGGSHGRSSTNGGSGNGYGPGQAVAPGGLAGRDGAAPGAVDAAQSPQSTFAVDVDTASYGFVRRQVLDGKRPDPTTVRPEEFINAFAQDYPPPAGNGFAIAVDGARLPLTHRLNGGSSGAAPAGAGLAGDAAAAGAGTFGSRPDRVRLLRIGLQTRADDPATRPDAALTFVIDVSGSMAETGKLDLVQDALRTLVGQLRPTDSVAIVSFNSHARVIRSMTQVRNRTALLGAIDALRAGGSTNLEEGMVTGYRVARGGYRSGASNRVILLSDGLANVGDTQAQPIVAQIKQAADKKITLLGVGVGSDYGDRLMERLADTGDGFVTYVWQRDQARELFVHRLPAALAVRAMDAKVQVTFNPYAVTSYRLIGYDNRVIAASAFRDDRVDGGEVGPGHTVTALYVVELRSDDLNGDTELAEAQVRWLDPVTREAQITGDTVRVADLGRDFDLASPRLQVCYAAAYLAEVLRHSQYASEVSLSDLAAIAGDAYRQTEDPQVRQLVELIDAV
jgi:Ca-activated chloride channel homolog